MQKLCIGIGITVGGWAGWWLGAKLGGIMTAFTISSAGSILGVYLGWKVSRDL